MICHKFNSNFKNHINFRHKKGQEGDTKHYSSFSKEEDNHEA
jgi:hypothetical protein